MNFKTLIIAAATLIATAAYAQNQQSQGSSAITTNTGHEQQPQTPGSGQTNAQGEQPAGNRTMQEKNTSMTKDAGGVPGATGSSGTQSGTSPNGQTK